MFHPAKTLLEPASLGNSKMETHEFLVISFGGLGE
jgi:hypothetical protein